MTAALLALGAFVLGSFPTSVIIARGRGIDLRKVGSGNVGATNLGRALGRRWAFAVMLVDAGKGVLPALVAQRTHAAHPLAIAAVALAAVLGHTFSLFLKGRGGKGVATSFGAALALAPTAALASLAVYAVLVLAVRFSSVGAIAAVLAFPGFLWLFGPREPATLMFAGAVAVLVIVRHKDNISRLRKGEELEA